jgi:dipeptidyl-peptidase-4
MASSLTYALIPILALSSALEAQVQVQAHEPDYSRAEQLLTWNTAKLITGDAVLPNWRPDGNQFWYRVTTNAGADFVLVDPVANTRRLVFDNARLAAAMSVANDTTYDPVKLPFTTFEFAGGDRSIEIAAGARLFSCELTGYLCTVGDTVPDATPYVVSPDSAWEAFVHEHNVYLRPFEGGDSIQLTTDGVEFWSYGLGYASPNQRRRGTPRRPTIVWSPDSRRMAVARDDQRGVEHMHYVSSTPQRPAHYSQPYALPGDSIVPLPGVHIISLLDGAMEGTASNISVELSPRPNQLLLGGSPTDSLWSSDSETILVTYFTRGSKSVYLAEVDANTGASRALASDDSDTWVELSVESFGSMNWHVVEGTGEVIWFSQRDGWAHLYRYDPAGNVANQITSGAWTVGSIKYVDEEGRRVYFTGRGAEAGRDVYYAHLYSVGFDGSDMQLLSPEDANHLIQASPSGRYFVDTYSRVDLPPVTVLRGRDGSVIRDLEEADVSRLSASGWTQPEPFRVTARDGVTELYGMMYKPSDFDPTRQYPIIDHIYPGPQIITVPKDFFPTNQPGLTYATFGQVQALAELGFIVVSIDHLGSPMRSKAFHDNYYGFFGDNGLPDHITAIKQLAARHSFIDVDRVGIYGHSGGGFASTDAILRHPEFFKVAVSTSGNHDNRTYNIYWAEKYQGLMVTDTLTGTDNFESSANQTMADNLTGRLFLMHGDMDDNVHPANTIQVADALIKANKSFDMLVLPDMDHGVTQDPYVIRRSWDYWVEHLLGVDPPVNYLIRPPSN